MNNFAGRRQKSETELIYVGVVDGYKVYYPKIFDNQLSRLKKGCPLWIEIKEGDCVVFKMESDKLEKELKDSLQEARKLGYIE